MSDDPIIDGGDFRRVLGHFPTGVTAVTAKGEHGPVGMAIGSFVSISLDPPLVGFFVTPDSGSAQAIKAAGEFCINVLASNQLDLCGAMASRAEDKFAGVEWMPSPATGSPILPAVVAAIDCRFDSAFDAGDHELLVGRVLHLDVHDVDADPMIFFRGQYGGFAAS